MQFSHLGTDELIVSRIAYGNSVTAGEQLDDETAKDCLRAALDAGITTFDTADIYADGRAEEILGATVADVSRDQLVICTKVGRLGAGTGGTDLGRAHIQSAIDASLRRLRTDYVDLYLAHSYDDATPVEETISALADVVKAGKARAIGVSEWAAPELRQAAGLAAELNVSLVANQCQYSMLWRVVEAEVLPAARECGIGLVAWSPLAGGVLTGKYAARVPPPHDSRMATAERGAALMRRLGIVDDEVLRRVALLKPLAAEAGLSLAQLSLAWLLHTPGVPCVVTGASSARQIRANVAALDAYVDSSLLSEIDEVIGAVVKRDPGLTLSRLMRNSARVARAETE